MCPLLGFSWNSVLLAGHLSPGFGGGGRGESPEGPKAFCFERCCLFTPDVFEWEAAVKVETRELAPPTGHTDAVAPQDRVQLLIDITSIFFF